MTEELKTVGTAPAESQPPAEEIPEKEEVKLDFFNPDTWGKTQPKEVVKQIQTKWNEKSTKIKELEKDYQLAQQELEKITTDVKSALSDPNVYREQRRRLGYIEQPETKTPELDFSKMETVGDVVNAFQGLKTHFETRLSEVEKQAEFKAESRIRQAVDPIAKERWSIALEGMKSKYGEKWDSVERKIVSAISQGRYAYQPGEEKVLLDKVFRAETPEVYEEWLGENFKKKAQEKAKAVTASPKLPTPKIKSGGVSTEDIIARVNARLGR